METLGGSFHTGEDLGTTTEDMRLINSKAEEIGVQVQSIRHTGKSIVFDCEADSYTLFREYITVLKESGRFSSVTSPTEGYPFIKSGAIILEPTTGE